MERDQKTYNSCMAYQHNKGKYGISGRDFLDKTVHFCVDGVYYSYTSSVPNDAEIREVPAKCERARTLIGMQKVFRDPESGEIKFQTLQQADL
jgi:hypothetical protein